MIIIFEGLNIQSKTHAFFIFHIGTIYCRPFAIGTRITPKANPGNPFKGYSTKNDHWAFSR
jgi:hypothetical protein